MGNWKKLTSKIVHKNPYFEIREDAVVRPNGENGAFFVIDKPSCVIIVPINQNNEVYLIKISRYTTEETNWELPIGSSDNQDELIAAKRELQEETGLISDDMELLGRQEVSNGSSGQLSSIYLARNLKQTNKNQQLEEGIKQLKKFPFNIVLNMIKDGEIIDSNTVSALTLAGLKLKLLQY